MVMQARRGFQANEVLGTQEWLKRAARTRMDVREPVCQALELKMSTTRVESRLLGLTACKVRYCCCCKLVRCEKAAMTAELVRGSPTEKRGVSLRMRVPAGISLVEKHPRPSPGDGRTLNSRG